MNLLRLGAIGVFFTSALVLIGCPPATVQLPGDSSSGGDIVLPSQDPIASGKSLYGARRCINCHGADGLGNPIANAPAVVGRSADALNTVLRIPCDDITVVVNCHPVKMPDLTDSQLSDLSAYLVTLQGNEVENAGPVCDNIPGHICTVAGNGVSGNRAGNGQMARTQYLFWPQNVTLDPQGRLVITDWNNYIIRRIENSGCQTITDSAGGVGVDCPVTNLVGTGGLGDSCSTAAMPVLATNAVMNHPVGILFDDLIPGENNMILWGWHQWKIKYVPVNADGTTGELYCLFGSGRGAGPENVAAGFSVDGATGPTKFNLPSSCVYDNDMNFYISDQANERIRVVRPDGDDLYTSAAAFVSSHQNNIITTFAGGLKDGAGLFRKTNFGYTDSGDGGPVSACTFNVLDGFDAVPQMRLAIDRDRNLLYVADSENNRIRVIDLNQNPPIIDTFAGGGDDVIANNVPATAAKLNRPADVDVAPDGSGDVLITDTFNHCVRLVDFETRMIHTVAGMPGPDFSGYAGDGGPATMAQLAEPGGAAMAVDRTVYIADTLNHRIRKVNP